MENPQKEKQLQEILAEMLEQKNEPMLRNMLADLHPADIADALERFDREDCVLLFTCLETEHAAEVLHELDSRHQQIVLESLEEKRIAAIISLMDSDDATDIISELDEQVAGRVLKAMPWQETREVKALLRHEEDTAGGIMALEIVAVNQDRTAFEAMEVLRRKADEVEDVYNIYVLGPSGVLTGLVPMKDLVLADPGALLSEIMEPEPIAVKETMDQEEVANLFRKYDLVAAPVIDEQGRLTGRITVDDVLDVIEEEVSEDIARMAGITDDNIAERSIYKISSVRLPWLLVAFGGELISAMVLKNFQASLQQVIVAAFFIPLIMAMGGNMGIQSSTIMIRGMAIGDIQLRDTWHRLARELSASLINALIIAVCLILAVTFLFKDPSFRLFYGIPAFSLVLALSLVAVLLNASLMGTLLPILFKSLKVDPAIATGPFITTSNDVLGLLVYFGVLNLARQWI